MIKFIVAVVFSLITSVSFAQETVDTTTSVAASIKALDLSAASIVAEQKNIETDAHLWAAAVNSHNKIVKQHLDNVAALKLEVEKQREYAGQFNSLAAQYNAQCNRAFNSNDSNEVGQYKQCTGWLDRLKPMQQKVDDWKNQVDSSREALVKKEEEINKASASMKDTQDSLVQRVTANDAKGNRYLAQRHVLELKYAALRGGHRACLEALKKGSSVEDETVKKACGTLFDKNHDTVIVHTDGIQDPVWKPFNNNDPRWHIDD